MVDQCHGNVVMTGVGVVSIAGEGLGSILNGFISVVGVVRVEITDVRAGGQCCLGGHGSEAPVQLLLHGAGQGVDITEGKVAVGAEKYSLSVHHLIKG